MRGLLCALLLTAAGASADVRVSLRLDVGHPIRRPGRTVIVRPARPAAVVVKAPRSFVPMVAFTRVVVTPPPRERLVWEDSETIQRREDWVDVTLNANQRGGGLILRLNGRAQIDFAEILYGSGQVQVVDFREAPLDPGLYRLIDFPGGRHVASVRLVARATTPKAMLTLYLEK